MAFYTVTVFTIKGGELEPLFELKGPITRLLVFYFLIKVSNMFLLGLSLLSSLKKVCFMFWRSSTRCFWVQHFGKWVWTSIQLVPYSYLKDIIRSNRYCLLLVSSNSPPSNSEHFLCSLLDDSKPSDPHIEFN